MKKIKKYWLYIPGLHLIWNSPYSYAKSHSWGCCGLKCSKLKVRSHGTSWEAMPLLASHVTFRVSANGPVIWSKGSNGEPVVNCWISNPAGWMCQKNVSGLGKALTLQLNVSFMSLIPRWAHSGGSGNKNDLVVG